MVEELSSYTSQDLAELDALMHELSATSFCNEELLNNALNDVNVHVYVIRDEGHIVATGTLCIKHTLEFTIADIESVVVSSKCRGLGYGKELMTAMVEAAYFISSLFQFNNFEIFVAFALNFVNLILSILKFN